MKKILIVFALVLMAGCGKEPQQEQKDDIIGTRWTAAYSGGGEKQYVMEFYDGGVVSMYLATSSGNPLSDVHKGTYTRNGNGIVFSLRYYLNYIAVSNYYSDEQYLTSGTIDGSFMDVDYYRIAIGEKLYFTQKFRKQ